MARLYCVILVFLFLSACGKNRVEDSAAIFNAGATDQFGPMYVIYDDELKNNGGIFNIPSGENQFIDLSSTEGPFGGKHSLKYYWNGGTVYNHTAGMNQHSFAGLNIAVTGDWTAIASAAARDFSSAGYTKVVFYMKGSLSDNVTVKVEGPDDGNSATTPPLLTISSVSADWVKYSYQVAPSDMAVVREFFKLTFIYTNPQGTTAAGRGGTVWLDNIYYEK